MAAVDFPASPALNQVFTASTGSVYQWNGTVWVPVGVSGSQLAMADTPPSSPGVGQMWWNSTLGQLFIWYNDGDSTQWVPASPTPTIRNLLYVYSEVVLAAPATQMAVSFPSSVKLVQLFWDYLLTPLSDSAITFRGTTGGTPNTTANYSYQRLQNTNSSAGAGTVSGDWSVNQSGWAPWSSPNTRGMITFTSPTIGRGFGEYVNITAAGVRQVTNLHLEGGGITGLDGYAFSVASGNFAIGSFLRCLVVQ